MATAAAAVPERNEWTANWPLLLAAVIGVPVPVAMSSLLGQFMAPLEQEFGWTRAEASLGYAVSLVLGFLASPMVGRLVDRSNARLLALSGTVLTALAIAAFSLATSSIALWIALWCAVSLVGALVGPTVWLAVISAAFEKNRSLAISIVLSGISIATMLAPISGRLLIDAVGWRMAWIWLALLWTGPALVLALLFFHDRRPAGRPKAEKQEDALPKPALRKVFLSGTFIRIALAVTSIGLVGSSFVLHIFPVLVEKGIGATGAAVIAGTIGAAQIFGKLGMGTIFDRVGQVPATLCLMSIYALAAIILAQDSDSVALAIAGCIFLGIAGGGFIVLWTCIVTRLFDGAIFGTVFGTLMALATLAAAIGPYLVAALHDALGTYAPAFWAGAVIAAVAALLLTRLKPVVSDEPAGSPL